MLLRVSAVAMSVLLSVTLIQAIVSPPGAADSLVARDVPLLASEDGPSAEEEPGLVLEPDPPVPDADFRPLARSTSVDGFDSDPGMRAQQEMPVESIKSGV
ncbi:hypothetical protein, partial [Nocardia crassostreae]|uniref:hypothetical protein n=1 Tax=Nocardia crassostreae TaxID=53428 RepID=UPI0012F9C152